MSEFNDANGTPMKFGNFYIVNGTPRYKYLGTDKKKLDIDFNGKIH